LRSPTVSSESHLTLTFLPSRSFAMTSIMTILNGEGGVGAVMVSEVITAIREVFAGFTEMM
jgi:hypothetical protein